MKKILFLSVGIAAFLVQSAVSPINESCENTVDGWQVVLLAGIWCINGFSTTSGVTEGSYSLFWVTTRHL